MNRTKPLITLVLASMLLAACTSAATSAPTSAPTEASMLTTAPTEASMPDPTQTAAPAATTAPAAAGDARTYVIAPERSKVSYSVGEVFINDNNRFNTAVGVTQEVNGEVYLDFGAPEQSSIGAITVDISTFTSDSSRRDNAIRSRWLESSRYPVATFTPTSVEGIPGDYSDGTTIDLRVSGDLTVREVTRPVTFTVQAALTGEELAGKASTEILMSDFGFSAPDIAGMLKAEDKVVIDFAFVAVPKP